VAKIFNVPIEPLDARYSTQWLDWFSQAFIYHEIEYQHVIGKPLTNEIEDGAFLDICGTNYYKASQLMVLIDLIKNREIRDNDVVFFHDIWFPGLEMLQYIRDGLKLNFKIYGCLHSGTYDPTDYISLLGMSRWGRELEESWFKIVDGIFVATDFHRNLLINNRKVDWKKIHVTGFPLKAPDICDVKKMEPKQKRVVFPHRLNAEKHPEKFDEMRFKWPLGQDWVFSKTQDKKMDKRTYYKFLSDSSVVVSFSDHENWGISMIEGVMLGCVPFVPNRCSYPELYPKMFVYENEDDLYGRLIPNYLKNESDYKVYTYALAERFKLKFHPMNVLQNMLPIMFGR